MSDATGEALLKTILVAFDDPAEKKIVKSLVRNFEKTVHTLMAAPEPFKERIAELTTERDFYREQFEQAQNRIEMLQGRI